LESTLLGRREDWNDPELQAGPHDAAERILPVMAPLKDGVVVELGIGGQSEFAPMLYKRLHGGLGGHQRLGPRAGQATVQGDGIENFNADAPFERQPLDGVEAIELGAPGPSPEADEPPSGGWPFALLGSPNGAGAPHLPGLLAEHILALHAL
jgi:hypothetical protein